MKSYPSIKGPFEAPKSSCHAFVKYDGSNIRAEWSKKRGWYKYGTRTQLLDPKDKVYGKAVDLFAEKYADGLEKVFKSDNLFRGIDSVIVFFEFFGSKTFAGMHHPNDPLWDVVLFDVNPIRKGFIPPEQFLDLFGHLNVAELVYKGILTDDFIQQVRNESICVSSKYNSKQEVPEGVICKGGSGHDSWMCKIKTDRYKSELQKRYKSDWIKFWES